MLPVSYKFVQQQITGSLYVGFDNISHPKLPGNEENVLGMTSNSTLLNLQNAYTITFYWYGRHHYFLSMELLY
jgi:hypothetical protein